MCVLTSVYKYAKLYCQSIVYYYIIFSHINHINNNNNNNIQQVFTIQEPFYETISQPPNEEPDNTPDVTINTTITTDLENTNSEDSDSNVEIMPT